MAELHPSRHHNLRLHTTAGNRCRCYRHLEANHQPDLDISLHQRLEVQGPVLYTTNRYHLQWSVMAPTQAAFPVKGAHLEAACVTLWAKKLTTFGLTYGILSNASVACKTNMSSGLVEYRMSSSSSRARCPTLRAIAATYLGTDYMVSRRTSQDILCIIKNYAHSCTHLIPLWPYSRSRPPLRHTR